jgi:hypothetical protein
VGIVGRRFLPPIPDHELRETHSRPRPDRKRVRARCLLPQQRSREKFVLAVLCERSCGLRIACVLVCDRQRKTLSWGPLAVLIYPRALLASTTFFDSFPITLTTPPCATSVCSTGARRAVQLERKDFRKRC